MAYALFAKGAESLDKFAESLEAASPESISTEEKMNRIAALGGAVKPRTVKGGQ